MFNDPDGRFPMSMHADMVNNAFKGKIQSGGLSNIKSGASITADIIHMNKASVHMDGMKGTTNILNAYNGAKNNFNANMSKGNYILAGENLHTVADFYSHSNYIPLYKKYAEANGKSMDIKDIPTFAEGMKDAKLKEFIESKGGLKTGTYKNPLQDATTKDTNAHGNMNLDENKGKGAEAYNSKGDTLHDAARATAQKDLNSIAKEY
jgi:hypothetical protein